MVDLINKRVFFSYSGTAHEGTIVSDRTVSGIGHILKIDVDTLGGSYVSPGMMSFSIYNGSIPYILLN